LNERLFGLGERSANDVALAEWNAVRTGMQGKTAITVQSEQPSGRAAQIEVQIELAIRSDEMEALAIEMLQREFGVREEEAAYLRGWQLAHPDWADRVDLAKSTEDNAGVLIEYAQRLKRALPKLRQLAASAVATGDGVATPHVAVKPQVDPLQRDLSKLNRSGVKYLRYVSSDGIHILVGQSDRSNDELVRHYSSSRHLWLHVRDYPGSHVLLLTNGRDAPQRSLEEAAIVAGYYSQGRGESELEVSYTPINQLRRPKGGKPGQVLKLSEKVVRVNPMRFEAMRDALRISASAP
ncbi:MAG: NFACT RNA binding domain-containing protein, partial [bacterium]|nr:NFACT RNA binding domain-containing protein [bacterium]